VVGVLVDENSKVQDLLSSFLTGVDIVELRSYTGDTSVVNMIY
jgi:hypothetical protein